ncbi:MAG TPA: hypothetical protein VGF27_20495, partial [Pseudoduganella sp.]
MPDVITITINGAPLTVPPATTIAAAIAIAITRAAGPSVFAAAVSAIDRATARPSASAATTAAASGPAADATGTVAAAITG